MKKVIKKANQEKCDGCGADLKFNPNSQNLKCFHCGREHNIVFLKNIVFHNYWGNDINYSTYNIWKNEIKVIHCNSCGGEVVLDNLQYAKNCPYCESSNVCDTDKLPALKPDAIIPFQFDENVALTKFHNYVKKKFFVPRAFKVQKKSKVIKRAIYAPTFSFNANTSSSYAGALIEEYTSTNSSGHSVVKTTTKRISGTEKLQFKNLLIESSSKINQKDLEDIKPFKMENAVAFDEKILKGYSVEHIENTMQSCYDIAKSEMKSKIYRSILSHYTYDRVQYLNIDTTYSNETFYYMLLPIYKLNFTYRKKNYNAYMNGQTGNVGGKLPLSVWKILLVIFLVLGSIVGVSALIILLGG